MRKSTKFVAWGIVISMIAVLIGWGVWYSKYGISEHATVCYIANRPVGLEKVDYGAQYTYYFVYSGNRLQPSREEVRDQDQTGLLSYYFAEDGTQFLSTWSDASKLCVHGPGINECSLASIDGFTFSWNKKVGGELLSWQGYHSDSASSKGYHQFLVVGDALVKVRTTEAGPNNLYVLWSGHAKQGPYADTTMPVFVDGKPAYVGWRTKVEERGAERVTTNAYVLSWYAQEMPIDCATLPKPGQLGNPSAADAGVPAVIGIEGAQYVPVVAPFDAPVCGQNVKIGLERRVVKQTVDGGAQTIETPVYSIDGQHHPIGAPSTH